jgi:hypothetical protein
MDISTRPEAVRAFPTGGANSFRFGAAAVGCFAQAVARRASTTNKAAAILRVSIGHTLSSRLDVRNRNLTSLLGFQSRSLRDLLHKTLLKLSEGRAFAQASRR